MAPKESGLSYETSRAALVWDLPLSAAYTEIAETYGLTLHMAESDWTAS
jgi:hypothetical protein